MTPQAIQDHLNQLDDFKSSDEAERETLSALDVQIANLTAQRTQQAAVVSSKDSQLTSAAEDTITLIQMYYKPGGTLPAMVPNATATLAPAS